MPFCQWKDENWGKLTHAIEQKECILMLGPDVPCEMVDGKQRPLSEILANHLAKKIDGHIRENINTSDLAQVADCFLMIERDRQKLENEVANFYYQRKSQCSDLYRNLAALPFYLTVTTTPDFMFLKALKDEGKNPAKEFYHFKPDNVEEKKEEEEKKKQGMELVKMGTVENPLVYYFYGSIEKTRSLVLTENDVLDFLVGLISRNPPMPENVLSELKNESKSFLFLGFGFRNWYLRILLHVLNGKNKRSGSFAMEQFTPKYADQFKQTVFFFQRSDYKIHIFKEDFNDFTDQLREKYETRLNIPTPLPKPPKSPLVFICHDHGDKDTAIFLQKEFKNANLNPWLDKDKLEGGEEWDNEIKKIIKKIDLFVIIHSKKLAAKSRGYVFKEIKMALKQEEEFRRGIRFIIPVKIDDSDLIEGLEEIQPFDLTDKKNINKLIDLIKREFKKREDT
jgi:hypothetical protein